VVSNTIIARVRPLLIPEARLIPEDSLLCEGDTLHVRAETQNCGENPQFRWYLNGSFLASGNSHQAIPSYSDGDQVSCLIKTNGACLSAESVNTDPISAAVEPGILLQAALPTTLLVDEDPVLLQTTPLAAEWTGPGISNGIFSPFQAGPGKHILKAFLPGKSCSDTLFKEILVLNLETTTLMLGTGQNENKVWTVEKPGLSFREKAAIEIYNRWGQLVMADADYQNDWNGSNVGPGIYFFVVTYTIPGRSEKIVKTGHLTFMP
jgi:hypothetical protein